jgi:tRNA(Ile)-lysidine synthase
VVPLQEQVGLSITNRRLFSAKQQILVAVSGGVDSMVLLNILADLSGEHSWKLTIAHLNHQLRGASSVADERLVRQTARELDLPIVVSRADVRRFAKARKLSIEMAARKLRHDFLAGAAFERKIPSIALAHHLDDQIELFFLRLFRGTGSQGLPGMKWSNPSPSNPRISLVRPLLNCRKSALSQHALEHEIRFREDSSNDCLDIQRNRIRHELLPLLSEKYQPALTQTISRFMDILGAESEFVDTLAESWLLWNLSKASRAAGKAGRGREQLLRLDQSLPGWHANLGLCAFEALPVALQRRCVHLQLLRQGIAPGYELVEHLRLYPGQPIDVSQNRINPDAAVLSRGCADQPYLSALRVVREPGGLVRRTPGKPVLFRRAFYELDLRDGHGKADWAGVRFAWQIRATKGDRRPAKLRGTELFDADTVGPSVILRHWRPGDRFQPIGMEQTAKLQDLFVNQKVPRDRRRQLAVASTAQGDLFWVEGLRVSERFKLTTSTIRRLHWAWQRL